MNPPPALLVELARTSHELQKETDRSRRLHGQLLDLHDDSDNATDRRYHLHVANQLHERAGVARFGTAPDPDPKMLPMHKANGQGHAGMMLLPSKEDPSVKRWQNPDHDYRISHPGLNKYPPKGVEVEHGEPGKHDYALKWRSPTTGKMVQAYSHEYLRQNMADKFSRVHGFASKIPGMQEGIEKHLSDHPPGHESSVLGAMLRITEQTGIRPGNESSSGHDHRGLTTLEKKHVSVDGDKVAIRYTGKSGVPQEHEIEDPAVARVVKHLHGLPGDRMFQTPDGKGGHTPVTAAKLNSYFRGHVGKDHSVKDLRTHLATRLFSEAADKIGPPTDEKDADRKVRQAALEVAKVLGHKSEVARDHGAVSDHPEAQQHAASLRGEHLGGGRYAFPSKGERDQFVKKTGGQTVAKGEHRGSPVWEHEEQTSLDNYIDPTVVSFYRKGHTLTNNPDDAEQPLQKSKSREAAFAALLARIHKKLKK